MLVGALGAESAIVGGPCNNEWQHPTRDITLGLNKSSLEHAPQPPPKPPVSCSQRWLVREAALGRIWGGAAVNSHLLACSRIRQTNEQTP